MPARLRAALFGAHEAFRASSDFATPFRE